MRKILLLIPSLAGIGGTERMVHALTGLLTSAGHEVHQASFDAPGTRRHFVSDAPFHTLGPIPHLPLPLRPIAYALAAWRLYRLKRRLKFDATISNLWRADLINALTAGRDRRLALCHINVVGNLNNRLMLRFLPLVGAIYRRFDCVVAVSGTLAKELQGLYRLSPDKIVHIDNFTDRPETVPRWRSDDGVQRFVWCGRFSHVKNITGLLHAWARFAADRSASQLVLVGEGPEQAHMRLLAGTLGLSASETPDDADARVVFAGKQSDPAAFMSGARALLLSSHDEGFGLVVLEALSLGVPVLAADCPSGGVRTQLLGSGTYNPNRRQAEVTPAGVLLPVPKADDEGSITLWDESLTIASTDDGLHASWCEGALERARLFSSGVALGKWQAVIASWDSRR